MTERGRSALEYIEKRGFDRETIEQFRLGYAPDEWESLFRQIDLNRFTPAILEKSGLFVRREGNKIYDRFRNRLMFPIINLAGRVVAFGGRALDPNEEAKYLNSPETPIYFKSGIFYGLNFSKDAIQKAGDAIIVEGYTDFLRVYTGGFPNVVAGSGTALTLHHARLIHRFTKKVTLCYDGDEAGHRDVGLQEIGPCPDLRRSWGSCRKYKYVGIPHPLRLGGYREIETGVLQVQHLRPEEGLVYVV